MSDDELIPLVFGGLDYVRERLRNRLEGLSTSEHLWEPVPEVWTVRDAGDQWVVDGGRPEPDRLVPKPTAPQREVTSGG